MTNNAQIKRHLNSIRIYMEAIEKLVGGGDREERITRHPVEPGGRPSEVLVKVHFTGDRDGNTFAVCLPTGVTKRIKGNGGYRVTKQMWKYTYETATSTSPTHRSWGGLLKTLDGHGRTVTKIEVTTNGSTRQVYSHTA